jgi:hypothetical protein
MEDPVLESRDQLRKQVEARITGKAATDPEFRDRLMQDPKQVVEAETGIKLPANLKITVVEEHAGVFYLVLPFPQNDDTVEELTEADLNRVEGGAADRMMTEGWTCADSGWF